MSHADLELPAILFTLVSYKARTESVYFKDLVRFAREKLFFPKGKGHARTKRWPLKTSRKKSQPDQGKICATQTMPSVQSLSRCWGFFFFSVDNN